MSKFQMTRGPDTEIVEALKVDVGRLDSVVPGLGARAVSFVAEGVPESVLLELANNPRRAAEALNLISYRPADFSREDALQARKRLLLDPELPAAIIKRLGSLMHTINSGASIARRGASSDAPPWLVWVVFHANGAAGDGAWSEPSPTVMKLYRLQRLEQLIATNGEDPARLLHLLYGPGDYFWSKVSGRIEGLRQYLESHHELVAATVDALHPQGRERLLNDFGRLGLTDSHLLDATFRQAIGTSKTVARAACAALQSVPVDRLMAKAAAILGDGSGAERRGAAEVLAQLVGANARDMLKGHIKTESSKPVREAIAAVLSQIESAQAIGSAASAVLPAGVPEGSTAMRAIDGSLIVVPPVPPLPADTPLSGAAFEPMRRAAAAYNIAAAAYDAEQERKLTDESRKWWKPLQRIDEAGDIEKLLDFLNGANIEGHPLKPLHGRWPWTLSTIKYDVAALKGFYAQSEVTLWHLLRCVRAGLGQYSHHLHLVANDHMDYQFEVLNKQLEDGLDLRLVTRMLAQLGLPADAILRQALHRFGGRFHESNSRVIWLYVLEHLDS